MSTFFKQILYIPFYNLLIFFAWITHGSIGWAIIIVTILIRILLLAPSLKAVKATTKLQALQPKMNEIKEKYKGDAKKQNEETMKMYKEAGASPLGCCGPMIIQIVVVMILYKVFFIGFDTANYNLLYDFTPRPDVINKIFIGLDMSKPELWVLPILAGLLQLALSLMTLPKVDPTKKADPAVAMNRQMAFLFPIMTIFIGRSLPSGLALYWIITTIFSIAQQYYVNKVIKKESPQSMVLNVRDMKIASAGKQEIENKIEETSNKKTGVMTKIVNSRLNKQDKKKGVEITIRQK
jgi:YidC/Oxa1 family membrane protein insertase